MALRFKRGRNDIVLALRGQWGKWTSRGRCIPDTVLCIYLNAGVMGTGKHTK